VFIAILECSKLVKCRNKAQSDVWKMHNPDSSEIDYLTSAI